MNVEFSELEAKETISALRHFFDASLVHPDAPDAALQIYISVIAKLQSALGMSGVSPWSEPKAYEVIR